MTTAKPTREERLAAKLRENLHRRKAQARAQDAAGMDDSPAPEAPAKVALAKPAPEG